MTLQNKVPLHNEAERSSPSSAGLVDISKFRARFQAKFGQTPRIFRAPGRVNLIGEHTDYNDGFVLPAAINYSCWLAVAPRTDRIIVVQSEQFDEQAEFDLRSELRPNSNWTDYPVGVCLMLLRSGIELHGANILVSSDVPVGAGLSSSAALEVSVGYGLCCLNEQIINRTNLALLCQRAENEFVGARCGIMDQFVSSNGIRGHAVMLDCRSLAHRSMAIASELKLVVCNTMVRHSLASGEYNERRRECDEAVRHLKEFIPGVQALRDVSFDQLEKHRGCLSPVIYKRARHVITENARVLDFVSALEAGELQALGPLMASSHNSLRHDFEVSCRELDIMVQIASRQPGLYGARMTGGGFGGCTINLVQASLAEQFKASVRQEYCAATGINPEVYICTADQGVSEAEAS